MSNQSIVHFCWATKLDRDRFKKDKGSGTLGLRSGRTASNLFFSKKKKVFRVQDMAISLVSDGRCKQNTAPRTHHTHMFLARGSSAQAASSLCVVSQNSHCLARMSCFALCLIHPYLLHPALPDLFLINLPSEPDKLLRTANRTLVWPFCRTVSAHRLWVQRSGWGEQYRSYDALLPSRKGSIGSTCNSGEDIASTPSCIGGGWKIRFGNAGPHHCYHRRERQVRTHSEFITLKEKVLRRLLRTFVPAWWNP